jgi:hypothetical protein
MTDIIFEALLAEASIKVGKLINKGRSLEESIAKVAKTMELTEAEATELAERAKKDPPKKAEPKPKVEEIKEENLDSKPQDVNESLYFGSLEEVEQATGVLMHKGIAWGSKGSDGSGHYLQFESSAQLEKAHGALKRRWDFVGKTPRKVAVVEFDNLQDYEKVMEFMNKSGLMIEFADHEGDSLDEDVSIIENMIREQTKEAEKAAKDGFIPPPVMEAPARSYSARPKEGRLDLTGIDIYEGKKSRHARIRKRWR